MADDFQVKITADLDTSEAEQKLNNLINDKNKLKIDVELNQNSAKKLSSDIEKGVKQTKLDTSSISKQLADSFNISDKQIINQIKSQLNSMVATLSKAWNGTDFHVTDKGFQDFFGGIEPLKNTLSDHAKLVQGATGIYDKFFDYFKDKKIFISDALKDALDTDTYKELLQDNIGKITRDASKGVDISSIWGEMKSLFPEHFSDDIINQADQLLHTFDLVKKAREDMTKTISYALFKVIDARKDALKKKKDYYDYDKTIKNKSKEINLLKQQIAALDGVTDAQSRAEKARLEAELAEKQEDFDDTVRDHVYELQVDGLDDLKDQLSEDFEKWSHELSANLDKMSQAIADAVANVGGNTADALNSIAKILEQFGINAGDMGITQGDLDVSKGESNQKSSVPPIDDSNIVRLNHVGGQIMITENGISTPMSVYDGMIPNDITEMLINMSMENQRFPLSELKMPEIKVTGGGNIYNTNNAPMINVEVQGDLTKSTLPDLQTILKKANTYTQNEIRKNMKRFG